MCLATKQMGETSSHSCKLSVEGYTEPIQSETVESLVIERVSGLVVQSVDVAAPNDLVELTFSVQTGRKDIRYFFTDTGNMG